MSYCTEPNSHIRDKVQVVLDLTNHATKKELDLETQLAKVDFIALKAEVDKLDINKQVNVPTSLNNSKTNVEDLDVGKLKIVPMDLKKLDDALAN